MGTYRPTVGRGVVRVLLVAGALWTACLLVVEVRGGGLRWWWVAYLLVTVVWNTYIWGVRIATGFRIDVHDLTWTTALRSGAVPLTDVRSVRSLPVLTAVVLVRATGMPWLVVLPQKGFAPFARFLAFEAQGVDVALRPWALLPERLPGATAWQPDPGHAPDRGRYVVGGPARVSERRVVATPTEDGDGPARHLRRRPTPIS